ncbi:ABC transporter substrate-binding protein [Rouxiella badensis]|jgi:peptide/nickel transport system substrate-binding protein|uniref:ABC transporter substrate-binding protein n=1 Tax=Rouxiella badensis TaxID=1646377 RepID=UPI001D14FC72|nr:ABC transporter substrate-binding protein [Rouxiella badensis]MCC3721058.1 ABC transporter substrate-binding protein [Rouxiella badensis]MCC3730851.1 ABC transporter substrate-binding protein [Rouxiella badensis]
MKVFLKAITLALSAATVFNAAAAENNNPHSIIRYAIWSNPSGTFHPTLYFSDYDRAVISAVFSRLFILDEHQNPKPSLAEKYDYSNQGKTLTLHLRAGVKWHDGQPFTAEDVYFTYATEADGGFPRDTPDFVKHLVGYDAYHVGKTATLEGIKVIDPQTISFTFTAPYAAAFSHFADKPVLAKHIWSQVPVKDWNKATGLLRHPVGTGPYKFVEFLPDQYVKLERNNDYFGGEPKTQTLLFKISNAQTVQNELINGDVDIAELSSWNNRDLQTYKNAGIRIIEQPGVGAQYLSLDTRNPNLADTRVREALVYGIDRQAIVDKLLFGHGVVFNSKDSPQSPYYPKDLNTYAYNPEKARALLKEAGWVDSNGDGFVEKNGQEFTLTLNYPTGNRTRELTAPIIQQNLKKIGINVVLSVADFNATLSILQDKSKVYDGVLMGGTFRPGQYDNDFWWERFTSPEVDNYAAQFNSTIDPDRLRANIGGWLKVVNQQVPHVWLYIPNQGYALSKRVVSYHSYPYEPFADVANWTVQQ